MGHGLMVELRRLGVFDGRAHRGFERLVPMRPALGITGVVSRSAVVAGGMAGKPRRVMAQAPG